MHKKGINYSRIDPKNRFAQACRERGKGIPLGSGFFRASRFLQLGRFSNAYIFRFYSILLVFIPCSTFPQGLNFLSTGLIFLPTFNV